MKGQAPDIGAIVEYEPTLLAEALAFQRRAYPHRRREWMNPRWEWMFLSSAARLGKAPRIWFYRTAEGLQAQRGGIHVTLQCAGREFAAVWFVDTVVLAHMRGRSIGRNLIGCFPDGVAVAVSLGQTTHVSALQDEAGWRTVTSTRSWLLVLSPVRSFRGRLGRWGVRASVATGLWAWYRLRRIAGTHTAPLEVRQVDRFGEAHDRLWATVRRQYTCAIVRDAAYLNWKYVEQPGQSFVRLETRDTAGMVRGVCVLAMHEPDHTHQYRRCWIIDIVADHSARSDVSALLDAAITAAVQRGVDVLELDVHGPGLTRHLKALGWIRGAVTRRLRMASRGVDDEAMAELTAPDAWFLTRGDSDGDHPWWTPAGRQGGE